MYKCFVCRYHEIATKGHNRSMFENKLISNIRLLAEYEGIREITLQRIRGRIFLRKLKNAEFTMPELEQMKDVLSRCFGLESFSPVAECDPAPEKLFETAVASAKIKPEQTACKSNAAPWLIPRPFWIATAVAGTVLSGVEVASTIRSIRYSSNAAQSSFSNSACVCPFWAMTMEGIAAL